MELMDAASAGVKADGSASAEVHDSASDEGIATEAKATVDEAWLTGAKGKLI